MNYFTYQSYLHVINEKLPHIMPITTPEEIDQALTIANQGETR